MKKRIFALVCVVVLCLCYIATSLAADNVSPLANCPTGHKHIETRETDIYIKTYNRDKHQTCYTKYTICIDCGTVFETLDITLRTEDHMFVDDICIVCNARYY